MVYVYDKNGHYKQKNSSGQGLWPRTCTLLRLTHAVLLSFDGGYERAVLICTGLTAYRSSIDDRNQMITCLHCLAKAPQVDYDLAWDDL